MKLFSSAKIRLLDKSTIENEPISSIGLMERAAFELFLAMQKDFDFSFKKILIVAGQGNNGGDGLVLARLLYNINTNLKTVFCKFNDSISPDCQTNLQILKGNFPEILQVITDPDELTIDSDSIVIDCIFGTGLSKPVTGKYAEVIDKINKSESKVIAIDIPSGLNGEENIENSGAVVEADHTYTIQFPPISSMFAENHKYYGEVTVVSIGLSALAIENMETDFFITDSDFVKSGFKKRKRFDHKGTYGHALLIAGSYGKAGAAVLSAKSCIRSGAGLLTVHIPTRLNDILQISVPEAMISFDKNESIFSGIVDFDKYSAAGVGPGLGTVDCTAKALCEFVKSFEKALVIDADALNILSETKDFKKILKPGTILTPHPKEFERLFGKFDNSWQKIKFMQKFSVETGVLIVLKGGITTVSCPDGKIYFNTCGNPGMATGGSGDVLTGIITGLLARGYSSVYSTVAGVFLHSQAGDFAAESVGMESLASGDIINYLPSAFRIAE
jgi:NAD(P)H-hydrate epimerase